MQWSDKNIITKILVMTNVYNEDFKNSSKCWICENDYVDNDFRLRDHYRMSGKYGGSAHRDCNINLKLNHKIPVVFEPKKLWFPFYYAGTRQVQS